MSITLVGTSSSTETGSVGTGTVPWITTQSGDFALFFWEYLTGSTTTDPTGFTFQGTVSHTAGSGTTRFLTRQCDGTETGNISVTSSGADKVVAVLGVYRGTDGTSPLNTFSSMAGASTGTSLPCPSATSTVANVVAATLFASRVTTGPTTLTQSSPFTGEVTRAPYTGGGATAMALADNLTPYASSGTTVTPPNWTSNFSFTNNAWGTWTVLLAPAVTVVNRARPVTATLQAVNRASTY